MTPHILLAVAARVLAQLRRDHRTAAMLLVLPTALVALLWWDFDASLRCRRSVDRRRRRRPRGGPGIRRGLSGARSCDPAAAYSVTGVVQTKT